MFSKVLKTILIAFDQLEPLRILRVEAENRVDGAVNVLKFEHKLCHYIFQKPDFVLLDLGHVQQVLAGWFIGIVEFLEIRILLGKELRNED